MNYFSGQQIDLLLKPIHPKRVLVRAGMSYVEGYDIKAELNRIFGFGRWSAETLSQALICDDQIEMNNKRPGWYVVYRTSLRLTICAPDGTEVCRYEESHVGESTHPVRGEAHGNALTNSWTYALKRCATNLGDQFGLSLYGKGSMEPLVRWTLVRPETSETSEADTDDVPQVAPEGESRAETAVPAVTQPARAAANGNGHAPQGRAERPAASGSGSGQPEAERPDAATIAEWGALIDTITSQEDADKADEELKGIFTEGKISPATANAIRGAIKAKAASLGSREESRQPTAEVLAWAQRIEDATDIAALRAVNEEAKTARKLSASYMREGKPVTLSQRIGARRAEIEARMASVPA